MGFDGGPYDTWYGFLPVTEYDIWYEFSSVSEVGMNQVGVREHLKQGWFWIQVGGGSLSCSNIVGILYLLRRIMSIRSNNSEVALPSTKGLGDADGAFRDIVIWPDGKQKSWSDLKAD